jgi:3-dehydroquinate synthase
VSASYRYTFKIGLKKTLVRIEPDIPSLEAVMREAGLSAKDTLLVVCDTNTADLAKAIIGNTDAPLCVLEAGEGAKTLDSVATILMAAKEAGLGRDGLIIGIGGGVLTDTAGFAASAYMRGCSLAFVSTTLLGMADASVGGKTGVDFEGIKNFAGTFYPARAVFMPLAALRTLPVRETKSGFAEVIKTTVLGGYEDTHAAMTPPWKKGVDIETFAPVLVRTVEYKGKVVEEDPEERTGKRALLNLGHTFGHALESAVGLGVLSHGEAVAWGIARACELGVRLGVTPESRAQKIKTLLDRFGYETRNPHPAVKDFAIYENAMRNDKKKRSGRLVFVVPDATGAVCVEVEEKTLQILNDS